MIDKVFADLTASAEGDDIYLVIFYTGQYKQKVGPTIYDEEKGEVTGVGLCFDIVGPVTDPAKDSLKAINFCEKHGKTVVVRELKGTPGSGVVDHGLDQWMLSYVLKHITLEDMKLILKCVKASILIDRGAWLVPTKSKKKQDQLILLYQRLGGVINV